VTNMNASLLLPSLAQELWHQAQQYVPEVLAHGPSAAPPPLGYFIAAQAQPSASEFQLPEPLLGPVAPAELRILVVGLNPGYGPTEHIPTLNTRLDVYIDWYAHRFSQERRDWAGRPASIVDDQTRIVHHYARVERDYLDPVLGPQSLGRVAVYADAIPWKWNSEQHPDLGDPAVAHYAIERVQRIIECLNPPAVITLGGSAAEWLGLRPPSTAPAAVPGAVRQWSGVFLPLAHPNKHWRAGARGEYVRAANAALARLLEPSPKSFV
jgi:hypothetical protein